MGIIADKLNAHKGTRTGGYCKMCALLKELATDDRQDVQKALADRVRFSSVAIARILNDAGYQIGTSSIDRHRRNLCKGD